MPDKLRLLVCDNFKAETEAAVHGEGWSDVEVATFAAKCDPPGVTWGDLREASGVGAAQPGPSLALGGCCMAALSDAPKDMEHCQVHRTEQCHCLFIGASAVRRFAKEGAYLLTPGWLSQSRRYMDAWGFDRESAKQFFGEFATKLVLLDTGVGERTADRLREMGECLGLPVETLHVGLDFFRTSLSSMVSQWRFDQRIRELEEQTAKANREAANYAMALDLAGALTQAKSEDEAIGRTLDICVQLFGPAQLAYLPVRDGQPGDLRVSPTPGLGGMAQREKLASLAGDWRWTESGDGFRVRIAHGEETVGILEAGPFSFPQYQQEYLNVALTLSRVCGLSIRNARQFQEVRELGDSLGRKNAELEAANKELEAFSYSVSHDLRAPLRSSEGFSQALLEDYSDKLDEQGKDFLRRVQESSVQMAQMIDDLLRLSQVTRNEMRWEEFDLSRIAEKVASGLRTAEPQRRVIVSIAPGLVVKGDSRLLKIALENLLGNSWKFTAKAERPEIAMGATQHQGRMVYFVQDNGGGFDMAFADKLFMPFRRLHGANEFPGTGIGLATVQRIIRRHGGDVWAEGQVGKGATFYFTLGE